MTKIVLAALAIGVVVAGVGVAYPELFGLSYTKTEVPAPEPVAQTKAPTSCCGGDGDCCGTKEVAKEKTGKGCCCGGPPKPEYFVMSANAVSMMASPQGQGPVMTPSVWMALRIAKWEQEK